MRDGTRQLIDTGLRLLVLASMKLKWPSQSSGPTFSLIETGPHNAPSDASDAAEQACVVATGAHGRMMDAGLVLASQNIEAMVIRSRDARGCELVVKPEDLAEARQQLAHYAQENRHRRWRQSFAGRRFEFDWQSVVWVLLMVGCYYFQTHGSLPIQSLGEFYTPSVRSGEWWRAVTAEFLHVDLRHLASNTTTGFLFFGVAMAEYGAGTALLASVVAGALANMVALWVRSTTYHGLGASGMVMAALGLLAVRSFRLQDWRARPGLTLSRGFLAAVFLFILHGFNPNSDVLVHGLGFGIGGVAGVMLTSLAESPRRQARWDIYSKWLFVVLVATAWGCALRFGG